MKKKKYMPYNFDEKYEYKTYINVGMKYKNSFLAKKQKEYPDEYLDVDNYTAWKDHFINQYLKRVTSDSVCNFAHYLNRELRRINKNLDCIKTLALPVWILEITGIITIATTDDNKKPIFVGFILSILLLIFIVVFLINRYTAKINFYTDCIRIIERYYNDEIV